MNSSVVDRHTAEGSVSMFADTGAAAVGADWAAGGRLGCIVVADEHLEEELAVQAAAGSLCGQPRGRQRCSQTPDFSGPHRVVE